MAFVLLHVVLVCSILSSFTVAGYHTKISPGSSNECFTETILPGGQLGVAFEVTSGGAKDIDAHLSVTFLETVGTSPAVLSSDHRLVTNTLHEWSKVSSGTYEYHASRVTPSGTAHDTHVLPHKVTLCFNNAVSRWTPKWVIFAFSKQESLLEDIVLTKATAEHEMELALHENGQVLFHVQTAMTKVKRMEEAHRETVEATNTWIMAGAFVNGSLLLGMAVFQYWYLTRFLSVRSGGRV